MKNKTIIIVIIVLGVVLAALIGVYFVKQNQNSVPVNSVSENAAANQTPAGNLGETESGAGASNQTDTEQSQNKIITVMIFPLIFPRAGNKPRLRWELRQWPLTRMKILTILRLKKSILKVISR